MTSSAGSTVPRIENDNSLGELDGHFNGDFLAEMAFLEAARRAGNEHAALGKLVRRCSRITRRAPGDHRRHRRRDRNAERHPAVREVADAIAAAGLPTRPPPRGESQVRRFQNPRNHDRQHRRSRTWLADVATRIVLPMFKRRGKPFVMANGRAILMPRSTTRATASPRIGRTSTGRPCSRESATQTTISVVCARRSSLSASMPPPTSWWWPTTGSRQSPRREAPCRE